MLFSGKTIKKLWIKKEVYSNIIAQRWQSKCNASLKANQNQIKERIEEDEEEEEESNSEEELDIPASRKKFIEKYKNKIEKKLKHEGGNKFVDEFFKNEKLKSEAKKNKSKNQQSDDENSKSESERSEKEEPRRVPLHVQAQKNMLEQKRKREEELKKKEN